MKRFFLMALSLLWAGAVLASPPSPINESPSGMAIATVLLQSYQADHRPWDEVARYGSTVKKTTWQIQSPTKDHVVVHVECKNKGNCTELQLTIDREQVEVHGKKVEQFTSHVVWIGE